MIVKEIPPDAWGELEGLYREEFDSTLPDPKYGTIYGAFEDDKLQAIILAQKVTFIGQVATVENGNVAAVKALVEHMEKLYPAGNPVATVASETRFAKLYHLLGMEHIPGVLFRRE